MDFNPHHRKGGDYPDMAKHKVLQISIHTTVKVVTRVDRFYYPEINISIHTTVKVVTNRDTLNSWLKGISIHTTVKVVTAILHNKQLSIL